MEAMTSPDADTQRFKMRFACARMAYEEGNNREAESLLTRLAEPAEKLKEHAFAVNSVRVGLAAVQLADMRFSEARGNLQKATSSLQGSGDPALQELYAVALRFRAQLLIDSKDEQAAERDLKESISVLEKFGDDGAVQLSYALSDLCGLYALQGRFSEASQLIMRAIKILSATLGPEHKEYIRADIIATLCKANESEVAEVAHMCGIKLQYQLGQNHPTMVRALRRYVKALKEPGDTGRLEEAKLTFAAYDKIVDVRPT
jgi:tetratricopeptide (TPR) repeat protein